MMQALDRLRCLVRNSVLIEIGKKFIYFGKSKIIQVDKDANNLKMIAGLAHEYGHFMSQKLGHWDRDCLKFAMEKHYINPWIMSPKDRYYLFDEEIRAWFLGKRALKSINYSGLFNWAHYYMTAVVCLSTYLIVFLEPVIFFLLSLSFFSMLYIHLDISNIVNVLNIIIISIISLWMFITLCTLSAYFNGRSNQE